MTALTEAMQTWLQHLATNRRYSPHTLEGYRHELSVLVELSNSHPLEQTTDRHIRQYLSRLHARGLSARSLARSLAAWRSFFQWWAPKIGLLDNPVVGIRAPRAAQSLPKSLSVEHTQVLLDHSSIEKPNSALALRDQSMFELFYSSGLRLSELIALDLKYTRAEDYESKGWLDQAEQEVIVLGKGNKRRNVPVGQVALRALASWIAVRAQYLAPTTLQANTAALFLGARGQRITPRVVQRQLAQAAKAAGLPTHVHPHVLRHSFASHLLQSAQDLRAVQEMLGHATIRTTQIYTRLDFQHLAASYDQAHPRARRQS